MPNRRIRTLQVLDDLRARHADAGIVHRRVWQGDTGPTNELEVWHANGLTYIVRIYRREGVLGRASAILGWDVYLPASLDNTIATTIGTRQRLRAVLQGAALDAILTQPTRSNSPRPKSPNVSPEALAASHGRELLASVQAAMPDEHELSPSSEWPIVVMNVPADVPADVADDIIESAEDAHEVRITVFRRGDVVDFIMPDDPDGLRHALLGIASDRIDEAGLPDALVAN